MSNPWDPFPFPLEGDEDSRLTFEGIGRVVSIWGQLEFTLARIYSTFVECPDSKDALEEYGKPRIFRDRLHNLKAVADKWAIRYPSQRLEHFQDLMKNDAEIIADRRNDIAHSVVFDISLLPYFQNCLRAESRPIKTQWAAVPAFFAAKEYQDGAPKWAYAAPQLKGVMVECEKFIGELHFFREALREGRGGE